MSRPRRTLARDRSGATAVEASLILPVLLLVLMGTMELGRMAWTQSALTYAVQEAARCAAVRPGVCGTPAEIQAYAVRRASPLTVPPDTFTAAEAGCGWQVQADLQYRFLLRALTPAGPTIRARTCRR